jgi:hypothetical protein
MAAATVGSVQNRSTSPERVTEPRYRVGTGAPELPHLPPTCQKLSE